ncbi:MAG: hypothetical protein WC956_03460 [bacterium]
MKCGGQLIPGATDKTCVPTESGVCTEAGVFDYTNKLDGGVANTVPPDVSSESNYAPKEPPPDQPKKGVFPLLSDDTADKLRAGLKTPEGTLAVIGGCIAAPFAGAAILASATAALVAVGVLGVGAIGLAVYSEFINPNFGT